MRFVTPNYRMLAVVMATVLAVLTTVSVADADEYQAQTPIGRMFQGFNPANWKMPQMNSFLPGKADKDRIIKRKDGLVTDVKETASRSWTKTKETFNPKRLIPQNLFGSTGPAASGQPKNVEKAGFFSSLLGTGTSEVEQTSGTTVNDFLRQNRPIK